MCLEHYKEQGKHFSGMQEDKASKGGWGQIEDIFEFADLANKHTSDLAWIILC